MKLSDFEGTRANNFTLLRFVFAFAVLIGHSFPITGNGSDPISMFFLPYTWIGQIAVSGFFAISGYLVTASIVRRSLLDFIVSRVLRLYPAIIIYSLVAILIIGPLSVNVTMYEYFKAKPWINLMNSTLLQWIYNLPYAFSDNPIPGATNGSAWTLSVELRCYVLILILGFWRVFDTRSRANVALFVLLYLVQVNYISIPLFGSSANYADPLKFFLMGSLFWVNRKLVYLNWVLAFVTILCVIFSLKTGFYSFYNYLYPFCLVYLIFMFVYRIWHFDMDRFGDISYGIYIYAWPIQQMVWAPGQSAYINILFSTLIVFPMAYLSWRFIEKPALNIREFTSSPSSIHWKLKIPIFRQITADGKGEN